MSKDGRSWCNFSFTMLDLFQISKLDGPLPEAKRRCLDRNSTLFFWIFGNIWELGNYLQIGGSFQNHKRLPYYQLPQNFHNQRCQLGKTTTKGLAGTYQGQWNVVAPAQKKKATKYCPSASFPLKYPNAEWISGPVQRSSLQQARGHEIKQPLHAPHCSMTMPSSPCNTSGTLTTGCIIVSCCVQSEWIVASNPSKDAVFDLNV